MLKATQGHVVNIVGCGARSLTRNSWSAAQRHQCERDASGRYPDETAAKVNRRSAVSNVTGDPQDGTYGLLQLTRTSVATGSRISLRSIQATHAFPHS